MNPTHHITYYIAESTEVTEPLFALLSFGVRSFTIDGDKE
jgi:hypothetical protein